MRKLDSWLTEYSLSHKNKINGVIHLFCVPLILFATIGILYSIPVPQILLNYNFNWSYLAIVVVLIFYLRLGVIPYIIMLTQIIIILFICSIIVMQQKSLFMISVIIFVLAWVGQFIGHKIEGEKPSFFKDLQFLLIGPLWIVYKILRLKR